MWGSSFKYALPQVPRVPMAPNSMRVTMTEHAKRLWARRSMPRNPKVQAVAEASGLKLGKVVNITEGYQDASYRYAAAGVISEAVTDEAAFSISPGQIAIEAKVTVSYVIGKSRVWGDAV